jgi:hypothetical protein
MNRKPVMHIGEWIEKESPFGVWFYIIRQVNLGEFNETTPKVLVRLIEQVLSGYGEYETRKHTMPIFAFDAFYQLDENYIMYRTIGNVNGEQVPVIAVGVEAQIKKYDFK